MLRIIPSRDAQQAKSYYTTGLSREDYYGEGQEIVGRWGGNAATRLGLSGQVGREAFHALTENIHPATGEKLTPRKDADRRVGYDVNFHCPKSLSLLHALTGDQTILDAFQASYRATLQEMEQDMKTRVRKGGALEDRTTGNMVWAEFVHLTARPVDGRPDPHLHAHAFVQNATFDEVEGRWKAAQFGDIKRDAPYYEAAFHARLAKRVRELGYRTERTEKGWEVAGIPRSLIEKFSQRTTQIEEIARERGITDAKELDQLGAATRENKLPSLTTGELKAEWESRLTPEDREALQVVAREKGSLTRETITPREAMDWALAHSFERASVVSERRLLANALTRGVGSVGVREMLRELERPEIVRGKTKDGQTFCTTREVLTEERALIDGVKNTRGTCKQLQPAEINYDAVPLSDEQKAAMAHVLNSQDRVTGVRGAAGTGKTSMMKETIAALKRSGRDVFVFAPSAEAARGVLRREGFSNADTVARLLVDRELQSAIRGGTIWIDEAGLLGTRTMKKVFDLVQRSDARLILSGDSRQHRSVERGDSMRLLEDQAGLSCAELKNIRRQTGDYRDAIKSISEGRVEEGFLKLESLGAIREAREEERDTELADEYLNLAAKGQSVLVVSPTHAEGTRVTNRIRDGLKDLGIVGSNERQIPTYRALGFTEAERKDATKYRPGMAVEFHLNTPGYRKGDRLTVSTVDRDENIVRARHADGREVELPLSAADRFEVFDVHKIPLAEGDLIRVGRNGKSLSGNRLHNGSVHRVKGFDDKGNVLLENGWAVEREFGHLNHGYVLTSHAAQGKTVDHVLIAQGAHSWGAANREQFYVSASRGRKSIRVFTDNRDDLLEMVLGSSDRLSGVELAALVESRIAQKATAHQERERIIGPPAVPAPPAEAKLPEMQIDAKMAPAMPSQQQPPAPAQQVREDPAKSATNVAAPSNQPQLPPQRPQEAKPAPTVALPPIHTRLPSARPPEAKPVTPPPTPPAVPPQPTPKPPPAPTEAPAASVESSKLVRARMLLEKYGGVRVSSPAKEPDRSTRAAGLIKKYTGKDIGTVDSRQPKRDKERGE